MTLSLSRPSLDFFKREARKRRVPDQRMIRALVDTYAERAWGKGPISRMERRDIRVAVKLDCCIPDFASLNPGYARSLHHICDLMN